MQSGVFRIALLGCLCIVLVMSLVVAQPTPSPARIFFDGGVACTMPCWRGITPLETTALEALAVVTRQPEVRLRAGGFFSGALNDTIGSWEWAWNAQYTPSPIIPGGDGFLTTVDGLVSVVYLKTNLRLADVWLAYDAPRSFVMNRVSGSATPLISVSFFGIGCNAR
jgi:hypothetical protein